MTVQPQSICYTKHYRHMEYIGQSFLPKVQLEIVHEKAIRKTNSTSAIEVGRKKIGIVDIKKKWFCFNETQSLSK